MPLNLSAVAVAILWSNLTLQSFCLSSVHYSFDDNSVRRRPAQETLDANGIRWQRLQKVFPHGHTLDPVAFEIMEFDGQQTSHRNVKRQRPVRSNIVKLKCISSSLFSRVKKEKVEGRADELNDKINSEAQDEAGVLG